MWSNARFCPKFNRDSLIKTRNHPTTNTMQAET